MRSNKRRYLNELGWGWGKGLVEAREEFYPLKSNGGVQQSKDGWYRHFKLASLMVP